MIDDFASLLVKNPVSLLVDKLRFKNLETHPVYQNKPKGEFSFNEILGRESCLCDLYNYIGSPIVPKGDMNSKYLIVGESPSDIDVDNESYLMSEDLDSNAFSKFLEGLGLTRDSIVVTPYKFCRGGDKDTPKSSVACSVFIGELIESMPNLNLIITMGEHPFNFITGVFTTNYTFEQCYLKIKTLSGRSINVIQIYSPRYCVYSQRASISNADVFEKLKGGV